MLGLKLNNVSKRGHRWNVITCSCPWDLLLAQHSWYVHCAGVWYPSDVMMISAWKDVQNPATHCIQNKPCCVVVWQCPQRNRTIHLVYKTTSLPLGLGEDRDGDCNNNSWNTLLPRLYHESEWTFASISGSYFQCPQCSETLNPRIIM